MGRLATWFPLRRLLVRTYTNGTSCIGPFTAELKTVDTSKATEKYWPRMGGVILGIDVPAILQNAEQSRQTIIENNDIQEEIYCAISYEGHQEG